VIGPNGAEKTTLFNLITGILKPTAERYSSNGDDITGLPPYEVCSKRISRSFQIVNVFQRLTVFENVQISVLSREKKTWDLFTPLKKTGNPADH
jgi:branched-chain amino acid transport system ATP-binding protein